jgi:hypothetical protein
MLLDSYHAWGSLIFYSLQRGLFRQSQIEIYQEIAIIITLRRAEGGDDEKYEVVLDRE